MCRKLAGVCLFDTAGNGELVEACKSMAGRGRIGEVV